MFDAIDDYCTEGKYAEVDTKKFKTEDVNKVVDLCFQCKLCYIKCPYTPGEHEWAIDFPRLIARTRRRKIKKNGVPFVDKLLGNPDLVGKIGTATAPLANWGNENPLNRKLMEGVVGIHKDKKLPSFAAKTFAAQFNSQRSAPQGEPAAKVAFFSTCYVNYNQPEIGTDTLEVMARNNVDIVFAYDRCCGMPLWHNGDMDGAIEAAKYNVSSLLRHVQDGRVVIATNPTCSQMIRVEYPRLLAGDDAKKVAAKTMDPMEFLAKLAAEGKLNNDFKTGAGDISYHLPCHLRAQNVGYKTRDVLALLPNTNVKVSKNAPATTARGLSRKKIFRSRSSTGVGLFNRWRKAIRGRLVPIARWRQSRSSKATADSGLSIRCKFWREATGAKQYRDRVRETCLAYGSDTNHECEFAEVDDSVDSLKQQNAKCDLRETT